MDSDERNPNKSKLNNLNNDKQLYSTTKITRRSIETELGGKKQPSQNNLSNLYTGNKMDQSGNNSNNTPDPSAMNIKKGNGKRGKNDKSENKKMYVDKWVVPKNESSKMVSYMERKTKGKTDGTEGEYYSDSEDSGEDETGKVPRGKTRVKKRVKKKVKKRTKDVSKNLDMIDKWEIGVEDEVVVNPGKSKGAYVNDAYKSMMPPPKMKQGSSDLNQKYTFAQDYKNEVINQASNQGIVVNTVQNYNVRKPTIPEGYSGPGKYDIYAANEEAYLNKTKYRMKFAPLAHNLGYIAALTFVLQGIFTIGWKIRLDNKFDVLIPNTEKFLLLEDYVGFYSVIVGALFFLFEFVYGLTRNAWFDRVPCFKYFRGLFYILLSGPAFLSLATVWSSLIGVIAGIANLFAACYRDIGKIKAKATTYYFHYFNWEPDRGTYYMAMLFIFLNMLVFTFAYVRTEFVREVCAFGFDGKINNIDVENNCPSIYAPLAKGFGNMLNLDSAIILIPVCRTLLTGVVESRNADNQFPIRKSIEFHQVIGSIIGLASVGHVFFHYVNYTYSAVITIISFGEFAWFTGGAIVFVMAVLFAGAHSVVKKNNYEMFWYTHHFYTLFFLLVIAHGPHFWQWLLIPLILFTLEKISRHRTRLNRKIYVRSVEYNYPVININFCPENPEDLVFREGQYIYLLVPEVNNWQWHPFSISSAFGDLAKFNYVSLHIRVQDDETSWTYRLKEYFRVICGAGNAPKDAPFAFSKFHHYDKSGVRQDGLMIGPDGRPLIKVDGPFNSPTQMYYSYRDVILVGSGIGITPTAGILRAILRYKWAKGFYPDTVRLCWLLRHQEIESFAWFVELLGTLMAKVNGDRMNGAIQDGNFLQVNIYITGYDNKKALEQKNQNRISKLTGNGARPMSFMMGKQMERESFERMNNGFQQKDENYLLEMDKVNKQAQGFLSRLSFNPKKANPTRKNSKVLMEKRKKVEEVERRRKELERESKIGNSWSAESDFDTLKLFEAIFNPKMPSKEQMNINPFKDAPNRLDDIWVWNGRPDWNAVFLQTRELAMNRNTPNEQMAWKKGKKDIGVCFCGSSNIGADLTKACKKYTTKRIDFTLNQEFF